MWQILFRKLLYNSQISTQRYGIHFCSYTLLNLLVQNSNSGNRWYSYFKGKWQVGKLICQMKRSSEQSRLALNTDLNRIGDQTLVQCPKPLMTNCFPECINHTSIFKGCFALPIPSDNRSGILPAYHLHSSPNDIKRVSNRLANSSSCSPTCKLCSYTQLSVLN